MSLYKFEEDDLFVNTIEAYPNYKFYIHSGNVYINDMPHVSGANTDNIIGVPKGFISLYEYNIDRASSQYIYPYIIKDATRQTFKRMSVSNFGTQHDYGEKITSSYNMSASLRRDYSLNHSILEYPKLTDDARRRIIALRTTLDHYSYLSPHYQFSSSYGHKGISNLNLISIPTILYGSSIKRGTVKLDYYISGSLIGSLIDSASNGVLVQQNGIDSTNDGKIAGVVLYKEGFIVLTGSWIISPHVYEYDDGNDYPRWKYWGYGCNDGNVIDTALEVSSSFVLEYSGSTNTQALTMLAHAKYEELNWSNNPTYISASSDNTYCVLNKASGSYFYKETPSEIKNIIYSQFEDEKPVFEKEVYISKIGLYDEDKKLIGVAKVATPVRKNNNKQYTFKLKLDI